MRRMYQDTRIDFSLGPAARAIEGDYDGTAIATGGRTDVVAVCSFDDIGGAQDSTFKLQASDDGSSWTTLVTGPTRSAAAQDILTATTLKKYVRVQQSITGDGLGSSVGLILLRGAEAQPESNSNVLAV